MNITRNDVLRTAQLSNLRFEENEIDIFTEQFRRILSYVEKLNELDTQGVPPTAQVTPATDSEALRHDVLTPSLPQEVALAMAPDQNHGHFSVPKVIE